MTGETYRFVRRSRAAALAALAGAGVGLALVSAVQGDWWLAAAGLAMPLPLIAAARLRPPPAGIILEGGQLAWWTTPDNAREVAVSEITQASARNSSVTLTLSNGTELPLPDQALPPTGGLLQALAESGVEVRRA